MMNFNQINKIEYDECVARGICSISPALSYLHEFIKSYLKELAFYLLKLREFGIHNEVIKERVIEVISGLIIGVGYSDDQFSKIIMRLSEDLIQAKELYLSLCEKNNLEPKLLKSTLKIPKKITLSDAIRQGQKIYTTKNAKNTLEQKNLLELMFSIIRSICIHLIELKELGVSDEEAYEALLSLFNARNLFTETQELYDTIEKFVILDHTFLQKLHETREEKYGQMTPVEVSLSTRPNKSILVSGTNIRELELLLEATQGKNIDIYTHGQMLMAHAFPKLKKYPHLVGHFGEGAESYLLDFASFPGAIFMTRHSFQKVENLYRSRVFTTDTIAPKGVMIIKNNNFEPLIESALSAKGFTKVREKSPLKINLDGDIILKKINEIAEKIEQGEIKHFFVMGASNRTKSQKEYFEKFLKLLGKDSFVLSFSYTNGKDNILFAESDFGFPIFYKALQILTRKLTLKELNPIILYTRCEVHTLSNILYMKYTGIDKIYFTDCSPKLVNPTVIGFIRETFNIKKFTNPEDDFKSMLEE